MGCHEKPFQTIENPNGFFLWRARQRKALTWLSVFSDICVNWNIINFVTIHHDVLVGSEPGTKLDWTDVSSELKLANWTPPTNILAEPNGKAVPFATSKHAACSAQCRSAPYGIGLSRTDRLISLFSLFFSLSHSVRPSPSCPLSAHDFRRTRISSSLSGS